MASRALAQDEEEAYALLGRRAIESFENEDGKEHGEGQEELGMNTGEDESDTLTGGGVPAHRREEEKRLLRKIDARLMPILFIMIVLNHLDRTALPLARLQNLESDLSMSGSNFSTAVAAFFAAYLALQVPSNMLVARVAPSVYLPACMALWGILSAGTGTVTSFKGLVAMRVGLGVCEAPFFPGALFLLSEWYTRRELALRTAILYSGSLLAGAFGGLAAAGIERWLDGLFGLASWRWLFLLEGACTVVVAIVAMFILPDYPRTTRSLSAAERALAVRRMQQQQQKNTHARVDSMFAGLALAVRDYKVWLLAAVILTKTSAAAITSFIPTLLAASSSPKTLTESSHHTTTLLLVAPLYLLAALTTLLVSRHSDRAGERTTHIVIPMLLAATAFGALALLGGPGEGIGRALLRYGALAVGLAGVYASYNVALAWIGSTIPSPASKRATAIAIINVCGNAAQVYAPFLYVPRFAPDYRLAMMANAGFCLACVGIALVLRRCLRRENERLGKGGDGGDQRTAEKEWRYVL